MPEERFSFRALDVGDYLSLLLLDSGHCYFVGGVQAQWLDKALSRRGDVPYKMAVYHVGAYPSVYPFDGETPAQIRAEWVPLFEKHQVQVAFEHHNHAYKRTYPLKNNQIDPTGVVYMGDGSWGVSPRKPKDLWYLQKKKRRNAVCLVSLDPEKMHIEALSSNGSLIDETTLHLKGQQIQL